MNQDRESSLPTTAQDDVLVALRSLLPLHAEEGGVRESVEEASIVEASTQFGELEARITLKLVRRVFERLCLLDARELEQGRWAFVSFPASLVGHSLVETLATSGQTLFEANYWEQGAHRPDHVVEEQRALLHALESHRARHHPTGRPEPIRCVHVAWALIRFGQRFLLVHREDRSRRDERNFVLPGGRLNLSDLPAAHRDPDALRHLEALDSPLASQALPATLARELEEELALPPNEYHAQHWRTLAPYARVEGARNSHGLTRYNIVVSAVRLTREGETRLLERCVREPGRLQWFSLDDLARQRSPAGYGAFIDALLADLGDTFRATMEGVPESGTPWRIDNPAQAFDLPAEPGAPLKLGKTGKERDVAVPLPLLAWQLLHLLAWHALGLPVQSHSPAMALLGGNWIKCHAEDMRATAAGLINALQQVGLPLVESAGDGFLRLSVAPGMLHLASAHFSYALPDFDGDGELTVTLSGLETPWAFLAPVTREIALTRNMVRVIRAIEAGHDPEAEPNIRSQDLAGDIRQRFRALRDIGLRKFIQVANGNYRLAIQAALR